jgi:hypothetical protein
MSQTTVFLSLVAVAVLNVAMNVFLKQAAGLPWGARSLLSLPGLWAVIAGTGSIGLLLWIYKSDIAFARAMLLLAATSLLLGVGYGIFFRHDRLHWAESALLLTTLLFYATSWVVRR